MRLGWVGLWGVGRVTCRRDLQLVTGQDIGLDGKLNCIQQRVRHLNSMRASFLKYFPPPSLRSLVQKRKKKKHSRTLSHVPSKTPIDHLVRHLREYDPTGPLS